VRARELRRRLRFWSAGVSRFEQVSNDIWQDAPFCELTPAGKLVYLWSFANASCGMSGVYKLRVELVALDTGLTGEEVASALEELQTHGMIQFVEGVMWCCARLKHLRGGGPTIARSVARDLAALAPEHPIRVAFLHRYAQFSWLRDELRPLANQGPTMGPAGGQQAPTDFPAVEGNPQAPSRPPGGGPMPLPLPAQTDSSAGRAREAEQEVWAHYLAVICARRPGASPTFDEKRRAIIRDALKVRDVERCKRAIDGLARSPHHNGINEQGTTYLGIRYALRGLGGRESHEERIDRMAEMASATPRRAGERPNLTAAELIAAEQAATAAEKGRPA
jgi:hypothetical protein